MDIENISKYMGRKVYFILKNGFKYKIELLEEYLSGNILTFPDKFGDLVSFDISEINFITISREGRK